MTESVYTQEAWLLTDLFPALDDPAVEEALDALRADVAAFEAARSQLTEALPADEFVGFLDQIDALSRQLSRLYAFGSLSFAADTQDQKALTYLARMRQQAAELQNRTLFFELWWKELPAGAAERLLAAAGDYRYWLEALRRQKPFTLSEPEEKVINLKDVNGVRALDTLYDSITNRYTFTLTIDGEAKQLTRGELAVYYRDADPALRAASYQELHRVYAQDAPILGQIYQAIVRDWRSEHLGLRGFATPISVRNLANDIPDEVVNTLLDVCRVNAPLFHRYFGLKARWLGMEKLRRYDIYAPVRRSDRRYAYADGAAMVLESFRQFDPELADLARRVFVEQHMDSEIRPGKDNGAFCATVEPGLTPWVLQSYQGRPDDVATMAHELGHAVHSMLAEHHTALTQRASLPLAETASTFGEMLLIDHLLAADPDPDVERDLLFSQMDGAYATIMRQAYFAMFERAAHERVAEGASVDDLSALYLELLSEQLGDALDLSEDFQVEWVEVPHFYGTPFYVYAYAFGQLLVLSLYQQYLREGDAFKPRYRAILAAGGAAAPDEILTAAGIDMRAASFWQGGFDVVGKLLDRLEQIPQPVAADGP